MTAPSWSSLAWRASLLVRVQLRDLRVRVRAFRIARIRRRRTIRPRSPGQIQVDTFELNRVMLRAWTSMDAQLHERVTRDQAQREMEPELRIDDRAIEYHAGGGRWVGISRNPIGPQRGDYAPVFRTERPNTQEFATGAP